jgi:hypothetical protein
MSLSPAGAALILSVLLFFGSWLLRPGDLDSNTADYTPFGGGPYTFLSGRYVAVPALAVTLALALGLRRWAHTRPGPWRRWLVGAATAGAVLVGIGNVPVTLFRYPLASERAAIAAGRAACRTNPAAGVSFPVGPSAGWAVHLTCHQAFP